MTHIVYPTVLDTRHHTFLLYCVYLSTTRNMHLDSVVVKMGRGLSVIKRCSALLTQHSTKQVLQALVLSYRDYFPVIWSSSAKKELVKLQLAQNGVSLLALHCNQAANINTMHASFPWLRVEERLTASLLVFIRNIHVLEIPNLFV